MNSTYEPGLVGLSVLVAMLASYSALDLASRIAQAGERAKTDWLVGGAFVLGTGIWAMHFIGMLALDLSTPLGYDVDVTLASMLPAFFGAGVALHLIQRAQASLSLVLLGGVLLGGGIGAMHYIGMAAMRMTPAASYEPTWFVLSIVFAAAAGALAIRTARGAGSVPSFKIVAAAIMGLAIAGMHYMGMAALVIAPGSVCVSGYQGPSVPHGYNGWMVALSITIAVMASYTALDVGSRITHAEGRRRAAWIGIGGIAMGMGIWAMHFIGMLAFHIDRPIEYDPWITFASVLPAMASASFALHIVQRAQMNPRLLGMSGLLMGSGIGAMHYIGMAAMKVAPGIRYDATFFALSLLVAVAASISALWIAFQQRQSDTVGHSVWRKFGSAMVMGLAIAGMHYAGMTAAHFLPLGADAGTAGGLDSTLLAMAVGVGTTLVLLLAYVMAFYDARIAQLNERLATHLRDHNQNLQQEAAVLAEAMTRETRARSAQDRKLAAIVEQSGEAIITTDLRGVVQSWNSAAQAMFGHTPQQATGEALYGLALAGSQDTLGVLLEDTGAQSTPAPRRLTIPGVEGKAKWFLPAVSAHHDEHGRHIGYVATVRNVTREAAAEAALQQERDRALVTLASIGDAVIVTDAEGRINYCNATAEAMLGSTSAQVAARRFNAVAQLRDDVTGQTLADPVGQCLALLARVVLRGDTVLMPAGGAPLAVDGVAAPIFDARGGLTGTVVVLTDVNDKRDLLRELRWQAQHDPLTGLANRRVFEERLRGALQTTQGGGRQHALLYLDLDQFKLVNDSCGHAAGDRLLRDVSALLQTHLRAEDCAARLGGDEFAVLIADCAPPEAQQRAEALRTLVAQHQFKSAERSFECSVSIGLVAVADDGRDVEQLLGTADACCYVAKESGRNRVHAELNAGTGAAARIDGTQWTTELIDALEQHRLVLYGQPIRPLRPSPQEPARVECLLRMHSAQGQLIEPAAFIRHAERYGLMPRIDRWVVDAALAQCASYGAQHPNGPPTVVTINLSGASLNDTAMQAYLRERIERASLRRPCTLCFEVTETAAVANLAQARLFMQELSALGCQFSLDDFGIGMSSFGYLKNLPVHYLKIDRSFVKNLHEDSIDKALVEAFHRVGAALGMRTVAEGVEDAAALAAVTAMGVDFAQGFHLGRPKPLVDCFTELAAAAAPTPP